MIRSKSIFINLCLVTYMGEYWLRIKNVFLNVYCGTRCWKSLCGSRLTGQLWEDDIWGPCCSSEPVHPGSSSAAFPRCAEQLLMCCHTLQDAFILSNIANFHLKNKFLSEKSRPMQVWHLLFECENKTKHTIRNKLVFLGLQNFLGEIAEGLQIPCSLGSKEDTRRRNIEAGNLRTMNSYNKKGLGVNWADPHTSSASFQESVFCPDWLCSNVLPFIQYNLSCHLQSFFLKAKEKIISLWSPQID